MKFLVVALLVGAAYAACPNGCSGHGSCGTSDVCGCYNGWFGGDCSYRSCAQGVSWTATSYSALQDDRDTSDVLLNTPGGHSSTGSDVASVFSDLYPKVPSTHQYSECSSRGTCDYSTGLCKCFDGFSGKGCRRTSCPNDCSGHGRCLKNSEVTGSWSYVGNNDQGWDQDKSQQCQCDRGYSGYDCSERICPFGDDPTTECGENSAHDYQLVNAPSDEHFTLRFTDMFGGEFETRPIDPSACASTGACREVQYALMELPNFAIPNVEVDFLSTSSTGAYQNFLVHFTDSSNTGKQNTLSCNDVDDPSSSGSAPLYAKSANDCNVHDVGAPEWFDDQGTAQTVTLSGGATVDIDTVLGDTDVDTSESDVDYDSFVPCSNKGLCDSGTGTCSCFDGHFGEACAEQSTYY